jgi:uncharacterized protein (TIGR02996 family)
MTDRLDFLATIAADDSDAPRLVFADWLEENDEHEHAELIRVQCRLADNPCVPGLCVCTKFCDALRAREAELMGAMLASLGDGYCRPGFDRGLITLVVCDSRMLSRAPDSLFARHPVRTVRLTDWYGIDASLPPDPAKALPFLTRLELPAPGIVAGWSQASEDAMLGDIAGVFGHHPDGTLRVEVAFFEDGVYDPRAALPARAPVRAGDLLIFGGVGTVVPADGSATPIGRALNSARAGQSVRIAPA